MQREKIEVGDYVLTTSGKVGVIKDKGYILIGKEYMGTFEPIKQFDDYYEANTFGEELSNNDKTVDYVLKKEPYRVLLGNTEVLLGDRSFKKLTKLIFHVKQGETDVKFSLPIDDAKIMLDILKRNRIYHYFPNYVEQN
jgi:hypothetical protein